MGKWMDIRIDGCVDGGKEGSMSRWMNGWWIDRYWKMMGEWRDDGWVGC